MKNLTTSRRTAMQQIGIAATGVFFTSLLSCNTSIEKTPPFTPPLPFLIPPQAPLNPGAMGSNMRTLIRSAQTNGQFSCVEAILAPKKIAGSPHKHDSLDELMYVAEGTASVLLDKEVVTVEAGSWHLRPRNIVHVIWNSGDKDLRLIDMYFNQNFEDYLEEIYHKIIPDVIARNLTFETPEIAGKIAALDKKFGLTYYHDRLQPLMNQYGLT